MKVIIADDNRDLADGLAQMLQSDGYQVTETHDGDETLHAMKHQDIDVAFIDIKMPAMNGIDILRHATRTGLTTRIILMTGYRMEQVLTEMCGIGEVNIFKYPEKSSAYLDKVVDASDTGLVLCITSSGQFTPGLEQYCLTRSIHSAVAHTINEAESLLDKQPELLILDFDHTLIESITFLCELGSCTGNPTRFILVLHQQDSTRRDPLKDCRLTGCLLKPFQPAKMIEILTQIKASQISNKVRSET